MIEICDFSKSLFVPPPTPMNEAFSSAKDLKRPTVCLGNGYECFSNILFMTFLLGHGVFFIFSIVIVISRCLSEILISFGLTFFSI